VSATSEITFSPADGRQWVIEIMPDPASQPEPDDGLRRVLTWTFVALVLVLLFSAVAIYLVTRWFA
jgi:hypothetical protein